MSAPPLRRPGIVTLLAVLQFLGACFWLFLGLAMLLGMGAAAASLSEMGGVAAALVGTAGVIFVVLGALQVMCGIGLWQLKPYGRILQIVFACIGLIGFPIGTLIAILILVYMLKPGVKLLFSGRPIDAMTPEEQTLAATTQGSQTAMIVTIVVLFFGAFLILPMMAAIAIPGLLRARMSGNEASAQANLRTMQTAQTAYAAVNGGKYASLDCLTEPVKCGAAAGTQPFLPRDLAPRGRDGYDFVLSTATDGATFVYTAVPALWGQTGSKSFCADSTGIVCAVASESVDVTDNACPARSICAPVR
jgi:type II secretory pathway pseudopilin PulG